MTEQETSTDPKEPVWPLVLMIIWYGLLITGSGMLFVLGLAFGSESYRGAGIPIGELLPIVAPLVISVVLLLSTILLWSSGKKPLVYGLCAASLMLIFGGGFLGLGLFI